MSKSFERISCDEDDDDVLFDVRKSMALECDGLDDERRELPEVVVI